MTFRAPTGPTPFAASAPPLGPLDQGVLDAATALGLSGDRPFDSTAASVAFKYILVRLVEERLGPSTHLRRRLHAVEKGEREAARREASEALVDAVTTLAGPRLGDALRHPRLASGPVSLEEAIARAGSARLGAWVRRVQEIAFEQLLGESVCPELRVAFEPRTESPPGRFTHAVVCGELLGFPNELYPLILDAWANGVAAGGVGLEVVGVHHEWLTPEGDARRVIACDVAEGIFEEREIDPPAVLDSVQFLYLGADERRLHSKLSARFAGRVLWNSFGAANRADRKSETYRLWREAEVPTPETAVLAASASADELRGRLEGLVGEAWSGGFVLQPDGGTEGAGVAAFARAPSGGPDPAAVEHVRRLQSEGDVVARALVHGRRFPSGTATLSADLRVNVAWDGERYRAESGYVQVAGDELSVASSVGRGGCILKLSDGVLETMGVGDEDRRRILEGACEAAEALASGLSRDERLTLVGLDVKLEDAGGRLQPLLLDANPRPAGLSWSESFETREPSVTARVWQDVLRRCERNRPMNPGVK